MTIATPQKGAKAPPSASEALVSARPRRHRRLSGAIVFALCAAVIAAVGMLYLMQTSHVATLGYELSRLQAVQSRESLTNQQLEAEIAQLQSLDRAERTARETYGMQPMESFVYLDVVAPAVLDLTLPEPPAGGHRSRLERAWDRLMGTGSAGASEDHVP